MVTKKTRWLSAFAAVIMLVSMLAGIIIPAGAETGSSILAALKEKYNAMQQEDFVEIKSKTVEEMRAQMDYLISEYEKATNRYEREIWEQTGVLSDEEFVAKNTGNLAPDLIVRYAIKGAYEQMGYNADASSYYISTVEDWEAAASSGSQFGGKTLLVTNDIDFGGKVTLPLTANFLAFQGILDGQGYKFIDFCLDIGGSNKYCGIVADLTGGTIKNLGVEGGTIFYSGKDPGGLSNEGVGTFAGYIGKNGLIQNCWSTVTLSTSTVSDGKNGISGIVGWGEGGAIDNCFFAGTVTNTNADGVACDLLGYGANNVKIYNSIGAGTLNCRPAKNPAAVGVHYQMYSNVNYFPLYNTYGVARRSLHYRTNADPYYVYNSNDKGVNYVQLPDTVITFTKDITHKLTPEETEAAYQVDSLEEAVWAVNARFDTTYQPADREYYISIDENGELYMSKQPEVFHKVTIDGSESAVFYLKEGTTVNLIDDLGLLVANSITIDKKDYASALNGYDLTVPAEDITLTIVYEYNSEVNREATKLRSLVKKYEQMDLSLFNYGGLAAKWIVEANKELNKTELDLSAIKLLQSLEADFGSKMALNEGIYPAYSEYESYKEYNKENHWGILSATDWLAMIDSKLDFKGYSFHLTNDVDFNNQKMGVLCFDQEFQGVIYGHGFGFDNIYVYKNDGTNKNAGLIGKIGASAYIENFGVNSGKIEILGGAYDVATTFGEAGSGNNKAGNLIKVWSGATIVTNGTHSWTAGFTSGVNWSDQIINGAYFYGDLQAGTTCTVDKDGNICHKDKNEFGIAGENDKGHYVYNVLSAPSNTDGYDAILKHNCDASARASINGVTVGGNIIMGIQANPNTNELCDGTNCTAAANVAKNFTTAESALEGAWQLNNLPPVSGQETIYWTLTEKGIRPNGTAANQIRKITLQGALEEVIYYNQGDVLDLETIVVGASYKVETAGFASAISGAKLTVPASDLVITVSGSNLLDGAIYVAAKDILNKYLAFDPAAFIDGDELAALQAEIRQVLAADAATTDLNVKKATIAYADEVAKVTLNIKNTGTYFVPYALKDTTYSCVNAMNQYGIFTREDWNAAASAKSSHTGVVFHLINDIVLTYSVTPVFANFKGTFNGNGHVVSGVQLNVAETSHVAIFGGDGFEVNNLTLKGEMNLNIGSNDDPLEEDIYVGGFAANASSSTLEGCTSEIAINLTAHTIKDIYVGGVVAKGPAMENVKSAAAIDVTGSAKNIYVGGIVGMAEGKITAATNNGSIQVYDISIEQSKNANCNTVVGGIAAVAKADLNTVENNAEISVDGGRYLTVAGIVGECIGSNGKIILATNNGKITVAAAKNKADVRNVVVGGVAAKNVWKMENTIVNNGDIYVYAAGSAQAYVAGVAARVSSLAASTITAKNTGYIFVGGVKDVTSNSFRKADLITTSKTTQENCVREGTLEVCAHTGESTNIHIPNTNTHESYCECSYYAIETCSVEFTHNTSIVDGELNASHTGTCTKCAESYISACSGVEKIDPEDDCTVDTVYTFDCICGREDYIVEGSGEDEHAFVAVEDYANLTTIYTCSNCGYSKPVTMEGVQPVILVPDIVVKAGDKDVSVDVNLRDGVGINEATLNLDLPAWAENIRYTLGTNVTEAQGVFTVGGVKNGGELLFTVTFDVSDYAMESGAIKVTSSGVKDSNGIDATVAVAEGMAELDIILGDADVDGEVTLLDAVSVLDAMVGYTDGVNMANADVNSDRVVQGADAILIVRWWLKDPQYNGPVLGK